MLELEEWIPSLSTNKRLAKQTSSLQVLQLNLYADLWLAKDTPVVEVDMVGDIFCYLVKGWLSDWAIIFPASLPSITQQTGTSGSLRTCDSTEVFIVINNTLYI